METPRNPDQGPSTPAVSYLEALVEECTAKPPASAWTIADLISKGINRNTARARLLERVNSGELKSGKFANKLYFWVADDDV